MTPREQLIQEIFQAPDPLINALLTLLRSNHSAEPSVAQKVVQLAEETKPSEPLPTVSALELAGDLVGCLESGIGDLSTNPEHMEGFGS